MSGPRRVLGGLVALLALAPVVVHLVARGFDDAWVVLLLFALPALLARRDALRLANVVLLAVFLVPLAPILLRIVPFAAERVVFLGAVAWFALGGVRAGSRPAADDGRRGTLSLLLGLWLAWSAGSALRAVWLAVPPEAGWWGTLLADAGRQVLVPRSQVEPIAPLAALWTRVELIAAAWFALELGRGRPDALARTARTFAAALVLGLGVMLLDLFNGSDIRGESFLARLALGLPRNHRPLIDNNALGSALVVAFPVVLGAALGGLRDAAGRWRIPWSWLPALGAGAVLLLSTRSKAALGAFALSLPALFLVRFGVRRVLGRPLPAIAALALVGVVVGAQFLPDRLVERVSATRWGEDAMRVARLDVATEYLRWNRLGPWTAALRAGEASPLVGHGLGSLPRVFERYREPELETAFNPLSENAHNQFLQAFAEEGLPGALALAALFAGAVLGGAAHVRRTRATDGSEAWLASGLVAGLLHLALNLQVGHSLLESSPALWSGAALGLGLGLGRRARGEARSPGLEGQGRSWLAAAAFAVALSPVLVVGRAPLEGASHGAYPWIERPGSEVGRDRLLGLEARWYQRWGDGDRMLLYALDPRPWGFQEPPPWRALGGVPAAEDVPLRLTVRIAGTPVLVDRELERPSGPGESLPSTLLKLDAPPGVAPGDLVEIVVESAPLFSETFYGSSGRDWIGPRVSRPAFIDRR